MDDLVKMVRDFGHQVELISDTVVHTRETCDGPEVILSVPGEGDVAIRHDISDNTWHVIQISDSGYCNPTEHAHPESAVIRLFEFVATLRIRNTWAATIAHRTHELLVASGCEVTYFGSTMSISLPSQWNTRSESWRPRPCVVTFTATLGDGRVRRREDRGDYGSEHRNAPGWLIVLDSVHMIRDLEDAPGLSADEVEAVWRMSRASAAIGWFANGMQDPRETD